MLQLEQNYLSVVVVVNEHNTLEMVERHVQQIQQIVSSTFKNFEIILVNNAVQSIDFSNLTISHILIDLFAKKNQQAALAAGLDMAIGDYIIEIPDLIDGINYSLIVDMYRKSQENYDFIFLAPNKNSLFSQWFYSLLNKHFEHIRNGNIGSAMMTLSSRRGQNRVAELGKRVINRNLSYLLSGLKTEMIVSEISYKNHRSFSENIVFALDTLLYYTNIIMVFLQRVSYVFFSIFILGVLYSVFLRFTKETIEGWASLFVLISFGFSGMFFILSIVVRYLYHILRNTNVSKDYVYKEVVRKDLAITTRDNEWRVHRL